MNILEKEGINPTTLGLLMFIKLNTTEGYNRDVLRTYLFEYETDSGKKPHEILEEAEYVKYVKTGKKDPWHRIRLSEKGEKILKEMNQKPQHELAQFMMDYLKQEYIRVEAKDKVKGGDKLLNRISEFLYFKQSYTERMIKAVVTAYVESFDYERRKYMNNMETLIFKPNNAFVTKWNAEECPLCQFIDKNQDSIKYQYKILK